MSRTRRQVLPFAEKKMKYEPDGIDPRDEMYHGYDARGYGQSCTKQDLDHGYQETWAPRGKKFDKRRVAKQRRRQKFDDGIE